MTRMIDYLFTKAVGGQINPYNISPAEYREKKQLHTANG